VGDIGLSTRYLNGCLYVLAIHTFFHAQTIPDTTLVAITEVTDLLHKTELLPTYFLRSLVHCASVKPRPHWKTGDFSPHS